MALCLLGSKGISEHLQLRPDACRGDRRMLNRGRNDRIRLWLGFRAQVQDAVINPVVQVEGAATGIALAVVDEKRVRRVSSLTWQIKQTRRIELREVEA